MAARFVILSRSHATLLAGLLLLGAATPPTTTVTDRERFEVDRDLRERQQRASERDLAIKETSLAEQRRHDDDDPWRGPLGVAVFGAIIAALGNAGVAWFNGRSQRDLEEQRARANRALERSKARAQRALDAQQAESNRILEVIKTGGDPDGAAQNIQFLIDAGLIGRPKLVEQLRAYLAGRRPGTGPALPAEGRFRFEPSPLLDADKEAMIGRDLAEFIQWLDAIGFTTDGAQVSIEIMRRVFGGASYDAEGRTIRIEARLRDDPYVPRREYMHHVLTMVHKFDSSNLVMRAVESALADYFIASFSKSPKLGAITAKVLDLDTAWVRTLIGHRTFTDLAPNDTGNESSEVWGSMMWNLRQPIGAAAIDRLLRLSWASVDWAAPSDDHALAFTSAMIENAGDAVAKRAVAQVLERQRFPLPSSF